MIFLIHSYIIFSETAYFLLFKCICQILQEDSLIIQKKSLLNYEYSAKKFHLFAGRMMVKERLLCHPF